MRLRGLADIGRLEFASCSVANVKYFDLLLFRDSTENHKIDVRLTHLDDRRGHAPSRKHQRALALLELFQEVAGAATEGSQRLNVTRDVQHRHAPSKAPF